MEEIPTNSRLPRNVTLLGLVSLLNDASSEMIYPLLPIFLKETLHATPAFIGVIEGLAETTASVLKLFSGWLSDRLRQRKRLAFLGYALASFTRPLIALATAAWHILILRFVDRTGKGLRTSPRDALIADSTPENLRGRAFGFHRAMDHAGAVVGPLLAMALLWAWPEEYRLVFALAALPALASLFVIGFGVRDLRPPAAQVPAALPAFTLRPFEARFKRFLGLVLLFTLGNSSDAFLLLRARELGVTVALLPLLWVVLHVVKTLTSTPGGTLSDRLGRQRVIALGWFVYALVYLGLGLANQAWQVWGLFSLYGLFFGLTEGVEKAFVADLVPEDLRGTAYGVYHFTLGLGMFPASVLFGGLWHWGSPTIAFSFGAALALIAAGLLLQQPLDQETTPCFDSHCS